MPDTKEEPADKAKVLIIAALMIISALGIVTYYDEQGNILVNNTTHDVVIGKDTKIIDYSKMNETTTTKVVYEGLTPIKDSLATKSPTTSDAAILKTATESVMSKVVYPYNISVPETKTTFKVVKYRYDDKLQAFGYWIEATREGNEVATNSPIWVVSPQYNVIVSEVYDEKTNEITATLKEDPKYAIEQILQRYVDNQPLGKATVGTKE